MNIKQKTKLKNLKAFTLAGLMGLVGCKSEMEPETPTEKPAKTEINAYKITNNQPIDSFMIHMLPNIENAVFYEPTEDEHYLLFSTTNPTQNVTNITEIRDAKNTNYSIMNTYNIQRYDNTCVNGSANFVTGDYWVYNVEYIDDRNWSIECVTDEEYNNKYKNMSDTVLARLAMNRILEVAPQDTRYANKVYQSILNKEGKWEQETPMFARWNSKGGQQHLRYSDFGTFDVSDGSESFTSMYSGGVKEQEIVDNSMINHQTFKTTAFGNVKYDNHQGFESLKTVSTGKDSATFIIDAAKNETIVMPFKDWYTVTIIRTNNSVVSKFEDVHGNISQQYQLSHPNIQENQYREGEQPNGLYAKDGYVVLGENLEQEGVLTGTSVNYYTDETGYIELVGQGYRQDWGKDKRIQFTFCFGGTNRPKTEVTTGLNIIYAAPKQNQR